MALRWSDDKENAIDWFNKNICIGMSKVLASEKEEIKCNNIKSNIKMINFDNVTKENMK